MEEKHINEIFTERFNHYLKESNRTQKDLARYLGVDSSMVTLYKKGTNVPRMDKVDKIARFFGINRTDLIGRTEEPPNHTDEKQDTDISEQLEQMMAELAEQKNALMFRGELMDDETKEAVLMAMQQAAKIAELSLKSNSQKDKEE